jgi:Polyketide cyclase / dehydrase and lipid transport
MGPLEHFPIRWNHLIEKELLKIQQFEHVFVAKPASTLAKHALVAASQQATFEAFSDFATAAARVKAIDSVELLTPPPVRVGTRFRETRTLYGKRATEKMTVSRFDPPDALELTAASHGMACLSTYRFSREAARTRVSLTFQGTPQSTPARIFAPVMGPIMTSPMQKMLKRDLEDMRAFIEAGQAKEGT